MKNWIILGLIIVTFSACNLKEQEALLPNVTGRASEVVLVINDRQWNNTVGYEFQRHLSAEHPALPQMEPMFNLVHIPHSAFSNIFKTHRNIVITRIDDEYEEPQILVQENIWAKPQIIFNVVAKDDTTMARMLRDKCELIVLRIMEKEKERYLLSYNKYPEDEIVTKLSNKFDISLTIPKGYSLVTDTTNFSWMNTEANNVVQGVFVYDYEMPSDGNVTVNYLVQNRNNMLKKFVPGETVGSYMRTEPIFHPIRRDIKFGEAPVIELRGLWSMENYFMGGPFVSVTMIDEANNRLVTVEGFVYAPQYNKRNYLRQQEAILSTFSLNSQDETGTN